MRSIEGTAGNAVAKLTYEGGSDTHEEEFKATKPSRRPDGPWAATEM
ncbi:MAG: hypothetical protein ACJ78G_12295 [Gemmatimonadaceae bacterium]